MALEVRAKQVASQTIHAHFPPGVRAARCDINLVGMASGEALRESLRTNREFTLAKGSIVVESGMYRLLVHTQTLVEPDSEESWFGVYEGPLGAGQMIEVSMQQAASFDGTALNSQGQPLANRLLSFASGAHLEAPRPGWTHKVRTGTDGSFHLRGLEPHRRYRSHKGLQFTAGSAGSREAQTLRLP